MTKLDETSQEALRARLQARMAKERVRIQEDREAGESALSELLPVALSDTGQSGVVAKFLLGLYNGRRFPFDLTEFRRLDRKLFENCQAVLAMDFQPEREIHKYFEDGGRIFESLAATWYPSQSNEF